MLLETVLVVVSTMGSAGLLASLVGGEHVTLDQAGIRLHRAKTYLPYASMSDAGVASGVLGGSYLALTSRDGPSRKLALRNTTPSAIIGDVLRGIELHAHAPGTTVATVAREGRSLEEWLAAIDARAREESVYREAPLDLDALAIVARDPGASPEARAAATYTVLAHGAPALVATLAATSPDVLPPLVVAAARSAPGAAAWIGDDVVAEARPFLDTADADAVARAHPKAHDAAARAKIQAALRSAPRVIAAAVAEPTKLRRHERHTARASDEVTRWPRGLR